MYLSDISEEYCTQLTQNDCQHSWVRGNQRKLDHNPPRQKDRRPIYISKWLFLHF